MGSKRKWSIHIEVTDVKGGSGVEFEVDSQFGKPVPGADAICAALRHVADELEREAADGGAAIPTVLGG